MRRSRQFFRTLSALLVGFMLFSQAAFATSPCVDAEMSAAAAVAHQDSDGCCEASVTAQNLCVAQCTDGDKLPAHTPLLVPALLDTAVLTVDVPVLPLPDARESSATSGRDPPKTIRFCSLLI